MQGSRIVPEPPIGLNAQKALAQHEKAGEAKNSIRSQIMDLNPVNIKQAAKERVQRKGEPAGKEVNEADALAVADRKSVV